MTIVEFITKYQPIEKDGDIKQFDWTVTHEWNEVVKAHKEKKVCTVIEGDDDTMLLIDGVHYVNRMFYVITKHPLEEELSIEY